MQSDLVNNIDKLFIYIYFLYLFLFCWSLKNIYFTLINIDVSYKNPKQISMFLHP